MCVGEQTAATPQEKILKTLVNCMLFTAVNQRNHALNTSVAYMKKVNYTGTDAT